MEQGFHPKCCMAFIRTNTNTRENTHTQTLFLAHLYLCLSVRLFSFFFFYVCYVCIANDTYAERWEDEGKGKREVKEEKERESIYTVYLNLLNEMLT